MAADADDPREAEWISRAVVFGDHAAFACVVRLHQGSVRQFLRRLCAGDHAQADDLAQDCFLKAWRHLRNFQGRGRFVGWLLRIAWQCFIDGRRRAGAEADDAVLSDDLASGDAGPEQEADRATLQRRLAALRPAESGAIVLHYHYGQSHAEIAETLGLPLGTIKSLILRARAKLRSGMNPIAEDIR